MSEMPSKDDYKCVVLIAPEEGQPVRWGTTADPQNALAVARSGCWIPIEICAVMWFPETLAKRVYKACTSEVDEKHIIGSWYRMTGVEATDLLRSVGTRESKGLCWDRTGFVAHIAEARERWLDDEVRKLGRLD